MNVGTARARLRVGGFVLALVAPLLGGLVGAPAVAAVAKPTALASQSSVTAVVLSWKPVSGATSYHVQLATSTTFDSPVLDVLTTNTRATPTKVVPFGKLYWRVSATKGGGWSKWAQTSFSRSQRSGPIVLEPDNGAEFRQSVQPPVLRWAPVPGAAAPPLAIAKLNDVSPTSLGIAAVIRSMNTGMSTSVASADCAAVSIALICASACS